MHVRNGNEQNTTDDILDAIRLHPGNILLAMGMHMLSPVVVSLPFKLLLFIMVDGWSLLAQGLLQPYLPT